MSKFSDNIKLNTKYADFCVKAIVDNYYLNGVEGSIRTGKDYTLTPLFIERALAYEGTADYFLIAAVSIQNVYKVLGNYIMDYFGKYASKCKVDGIFPAIRFKHRHGTKYFIFAGGKNKGSDDMIQGLTLGGWYATEINLLHKDFVNEMMSRIGEGGRECFGFFTLNPLNEEHYFYTEFLNIWQDEEERLNDRFLNYMHVTLYDAPNMTTDKIELMKRGKNPNSVEYKRDILGLRVSAEGAIYEITDKHILQDYKPEDYIRIITVADPGKTKSGTGFIVAGLTFNKDTKQLEMHVLREFYHRNESNNTSNKLNVIEYANKYADFIYSAAAEFKKYPERVYTDTDIDFYDLLMKRLRADGKANNVSYPIKGGVIGEIDARIKNGVSLLYQHKLRFYKTCERSLQMFRAAQYDPKSYKSEGKLIRLDDPANNQSVDMIDCTEYAFNHFYKELTK